MLDTADFTLHGLTLRQLATGEQLADVLGLDAAEIEGHLEQAAADGKVIAARGAYMITPGGREHLDTRYPQDFAGERADERLVATLADFEQGTNKRMLALMTSWQTITVGGVEQPNDHSDADYDAKIVDKLAALHERAAAQLAPFAEADPLTERFISRLGEAMANVDKGDHEYISNVRIDSYHTVWYQMHEHLLRLMGEERDE